MENEYCKCYQLWTICIEFQFDDLVHCDWQLGMGD